MHPVVLCPCCLVHAVRRNHLQGCHKVESFGCITQNLCFTIGVSLRSWGTCADFIGEDHR